MPLNPDAKLPSEWSDWNERSWNSKDSLLYALGVGAGATDPTGFELEFTTENSRDVTQRALPTMAVVLGGAGGGMRDIGTFNPAFLVDGGRTITWHKELPVEGRIKSRGRTLGIYEKGKNAIVRSESETVDAATDEPLFNIKSHIILRGEAPFGGQEDTVEKIAYPDTHARRGDHVSDRGPIRRCSTASTGTATRSTPIRSTPRWPASRSRSSTAWAPSGSPVGRSCTAWPAPTPRS